MTENSKNLPVEESEKSLNNDVKLNFGKLKFEKPEDAEAYARDNLNIQASFAGNLIPANIFLNGLEDIKEKGYALPKRVIVDSKRFEQYGDEGVYRTPAETVTSDGGTIYINDKFDWGNIRERMSKNYEGKKLSTDNPKHLVYHENGHIDHYLSDPKAWNNNEEIPPDIQSLIQDEVSLYGSQEWPEFVAEVFAKKVQGKTLSDKINKLYQEQKGPEPGQTSGIMNNKMKWL